MGKTLKRPGTAKSIKLTLGETLLLFRKDAEMNQFELALELGLTLHEYKLREYDKVVDKKLSTKFKNNVKLRPHEKCLVHRKRAGLSQAQVAKEMGISRQWMREQETGKIPCDKLLAYWGE